MRLKEHIYIIALAVLLLPVSLFADQTGDCDAGTQYCEANTLETL